MRGQAGRKPIERRRCRSAEPLLCRRRAAARVPLGRSAAAMSGLRKLKWHEKKLLRKVDFLEWKQEKNIRVIKILRRYVIENREDYTK